MSMDTQKPIVFLAFANEHNDQTLYLRQLNEEYRRLRGTLQVAEEKGWCQLEIDSAATINSILDTFTKYRNQIAVFHFAGHANGYQLLLESSEGQSATANAGGLAKFLGQQTGLQLIFLNGCSTRQQAKALLDAGVASVITTSQAIDDKVAMEFSDRFYRQLAGGTHLQTAFNEAEAALRIEYGNDDSDVDRKVLIRDSESKGDDWPWMLHLKEGSEVVARWNLPDVVNDPYFGLPLLPEGKLPSKPFLGLNYFRKEDAEIFFWSRPANP